MNKQLGFSLVEIMIALLIGLFLLGGVLQLFSATSQSYRMQSNLARLQENGRFALDFLEHDIRMAGYWSCMSSTSDIFGIDGAVSDTITLHGAFELTPTGACGSPVDSPNSCGSVNCYTDPSSTITYQINTPSGTSSLPDPEITLYRSSNPLIEGIENMQILYGIDFNKDKVADYYVSANSAWLAADWLNVISLRISLLVVTVDDYLTTQHMPYSYNGVTTTPTDYKIRRVFNTTIAIRNHL